MKHKILLAASTKTDINYLIEGLFSLLNKTDIKYVSLIYPENILNDRDRVVPKHKGLDELVEESEKILAVKKKASLYNIIFDTVENIKVADKLASLSVIYDLLIWEYSSFSMLEDSVAKEITRHIKCPVLLLPKNWEVKNLIILHDHSVDSIKMIKSFINLFNPALLELPLSILVTDPKNNAEVEGEKVLVDYLKLFFSNIGIQSMCHDPIDCLNQRVVYDSERPFLMLGGANEDNSNFYQTSLRGQSKVPVFIFKT